MSDARGQEPATSLPKPAVHEAAGERGQEQVPRSKRVVPHVCEGKHTGLDDNRRPLPETVADGRLKEPPEERLFLEGSDREAESVQQQCPDQ